MSKRGNIKKENSKEWKEYQVASDNINHFNRQNEFIMVDGESVANDVTKMPEYKILNKKFKESLKKVNQMGYAKGGVPDYVNWEYPIYFDSEGKEYVAIYYSDRTDEAEADTDFDNRIADSLIPDVIKEHLGDNKWEEQDVEAELGKEEFFNDLEYALETSSISGERVDYAKGGSVEDKEYVLDRYYVYVNKDSWTEGQTEEVQHWDSSDYGEDNQVFSSKSDLMHFIKGVIERDTDEDNVEDKYFNIDADDDDTKIDYSVLCKYIDLDRGYDHYEKASDEEIEKWKKGELELVSVGFTFAVSTYSIRVKAEFAKGGKIDTFKSTKDYENHLRYNDGTPFDSVIIDKEEFTQDMYDMEGKLITYRGNKGSMLEIENSNRYESDYDNNYNGFGDSEVSISEGVYAPYKDLSPEEQSNFPFAKGGKVEKKENNEMIMGGLAGILFGFLLNK